MRLELLAEQVPGAVVVRGPETEITRIVYDSRSATTGDLFVAIRGLRSDGHDFAADAGRRGAAVAAERPLPLPPDTPTLTLPDTRLALGQLAAVLHRRPARALKMVGVTGSAGKTTTTHLTAHVLESRGLAPGLLSSMEHKLPGTAAIANPTGRTTMEAPEVQACLARMVEAGARSAVIETSSHALDQGRVEGCEFDVAAFTNLGRDHLDYHGSMEGYTAAKARLIELCAAGADKGVPKTAVLNRDDPVWEAMAGRPIARRIGYGTSPEADVRAVGVTADDEGTSFRLEALGAAAPVRLGLVGLYNVANALCAASCGLALGLTVEQVAAGLSSFPGLRGRMERLDLGQPFRVYIDFSHTAICLTTALTELRARADRRLLAVFGMSGGSDHDPAGMGRAASALSDYFVITTDDPAPRDPAVIAREIEAGVDGSAARGRDYDVILDRGAAIRQVMRSARPGDVVLLAGKGHEQTLLLPSGAIPWDERQEAESALRELGLAAGS
jgi:UDP-N-acetylmuramoyl-L-alanyl-D-glutamate--2,6-diaminopimelate ligase